MMGSERTHRVISIAAALLLPLATVGCASKKFVRNSVQPLEARLGTVEQKSSANANDIRDLDQKTEKGIADAQKAADQAAGQASKADQDAQSANQLAQKGVDQALQVKEDLNNIDKFQPVTTETVLFAFDRSVLTDQGKQKLDELAQKVQSMPHYVIQVQGFTDATGPEQYNLVLSQRRADAVVRYLTMEHKIPLVRIYKLGYGEESPVASNKNREGREENRRVDVTLMAPQTMNAATKPTASSSASLSQ
jgi:OOP family OmpA-OmpF porin